jgi:IMP cyclohydrolase
MTDIAAALHANPYPGRVLLLARTGDGQLVAGYALTGRSPSSKAREMVVHDGEIVVRPVGAQGHDRLRHYVAAQAGPELTVFGNGEQVGEVFARLGTGLAPPLALDGVGYEPDPPIFTPRITAVVDRRDGTAWLGAARRSGGRRDGADVTVTTVRDLAVGDLVLLSTYRSDGESIQTAPHHVDLRTGAADAAALLDEVYAALDPRFAVAVTTFTPLGGVHDAVVLHAGVPR